jgi:predicted nucleic acid-binding protein
MWAKAPITLDTNVAIYAFTNQEEKADIARTILARSDFMSAQVLNEFVNVARRKHQRSWPDISLAAERLRRAVPTILPIDEAAHLEGLRVADRYQLGFYDALLVAVALAGGARTLYSEDMQHGMTVDQTVRIVNPFLPGAIDP